MTHTYDTNSPWPLLDYNSWKSTCMALHLWAQIIGKYRLAHTPWVNHSWHATLYITPRGLTTGSVPDPKGMVTLNLDFREHRFIALGPDGSTQTFPLQAMSVATFFRQTLEAIESVGGTPKIHGKPNELLDPIPFADDDARRPYDREAVERFHQALLRIEPVLSRFRTTFLGKVSPVHLFWGSFDLAITRFSARLAPTHPGGVPHLPDAVAQEAYSHEVSSAGFWPGGAGVDEAMFYSYAYPEPDGFQSQNIEPESAFYDPDLGEFLLPYKAVQSAPNPEATLMRFLVTTYEAAADCGHWNRDALECEVGRPRVPRSLDR